MRKLSRLGSRLGLRGQAITLPVDTTAPTITSTNPSGGYAEMAPISGTLTASEPVTWSKSGADAARVTLNPATGAWSLETTDFETKASYSWSFVATDAALNASTPQNVAITITDVDEIPNAFAFTDVTGATVSTQYTSNTITVAGLAAGVSVPVAVSGGTYSKNGGAYTSAAGTAQNGDTFSVRQTSSASNSTATDVALTIGGVSDTYTVTTAASGAATILYGRTAGYSSGTTFDYVVDSINGDDTTGTGSLAAPFKTTTKAHTVAVAAGGNKKIALRGHQGQIYTAAITCVTNGIEFHGYDTEQPKWYGSYTVTGFTQCVAGDASVVGSNYASIYKATFTTSGNIDPTVSFNNLIPLENGVPLNLVQLRHDVSDLYFQDSTDDFYDSTLHGDSVTIAQTGTDITTITHAAVLGNGTTPYTDAQLTNCSVMVHAQPNAAKLVKVQSASGGVLTLVANGLQKQAGGDGYALLNLLPALSVGEYGVVNNGDGTWTLYVWPNDPANLAAGVPVASKKTILKFSQCSDNKVSNIEFGHCANSGTDATIAGVVFDRTTNGQFIQNTIQYYGFQDFIGNGGIIVVGGTSNLIQYNDVKEGQNDFGIFLNNSSYTATGNRVLHNYIYRSSLTPIRGYGQLLIAVVDNKARSCGKGGHANKINFYLQSDQVLCWRNDLDDNGGYLTNSQSSRMMFGMNFSPADPTGSDARAYADQSAANPPGPLPITDPSDNYLVQNFFEKPFGNTNATGQNAINVDVKLVSEGGTITTQTKWGIWNNVTRGIDVETTLQLAGSPDYNFITGGTAAGSNNITVTDHDAIYYDYPNGNYNTLPSSDLTTASGLDLTSVIELYEGWFPDINLRMTLNGYAWDPADPGIGCYGKHWPVQVDVTAPVLSDLSADISGASASVTVTTDERGGTLYWVRYNGGSTPTAAQVVAGLDALGSAALSSGSETVGDAGAQGPWTVTGTAGATDTLAVVHEDRHGNISAVVTTSLAFAAYSPTWVAFDGVHWLRKSSALTGFQAGTKKVIIAFTMKRSAAQLTTAVAGGIMVAVGSSDSVPNYSTTGTSKLTMIQETNANTAFTTLTVPPSTAMVADTEYLVIATIYDDGTNAIMKAVMYNIATGAQLGSTASSGLLATASFTFKNNYDLFKAAATYERFMLWDNPSIATPDATDATLRGYFMSGGALLDPAVAIANVGTPLISLSDAALAVASGATVTNGGSGGNFTMT